MLLVSSQLALDFGRTSDEKLGVFLCVFVGKGRVFPIDTLLNTRY